MTITKTMKMFAAAALLAVSFNASASFIDGDITMGGNFVPSNGSSLGNATGIDFLDDDFVVQGVTGDFADAGIQLYDIGVYHDFEFDPLDANTLVWEIGGFSFTLDSISVVLHNNFILVLQGTGVISGNGFEDTEGNWNLTGQGFNGIFSFSSSATPVAEPATLALVGLGLIGLAVARRRS